MRLQTVSPLRRQPYQGDRIDLVIGIDVGTTFSGVSYAILRPGEVPEVKPVTTFSGQTFTDSKIPSVIYYDDEGTIQAIGAETSKDEVESDAFENGWTKVQYFKMHLRPSSMVIDTNGLELGELPPGVSVEKAMGDFLRYLFSEAASFIKDAHTDGTSIWREVQGRINFVLSHPNGWTGVSQQRMRKSAILGKLVPGTEEGRRRLTFITEGEASALSCLSSGLGPSKLTPGFSFIVADAGGGTLDISSYCVKGVNPIELEEIACADCRFAGSIFVNREMSVLLSRKLANSKYEDDLHEIVKNFDDKAKKEYDGEMSFGLVKVGGRRERSESLRIQNGFLKLSSEELAKCFAFPVAQAIGSVHQQMKDCGSTEIPVWLVGGFGNSPFLLKKLREAFEGPGSTVTRPNDNLSKAVANGAVLHFLDHSVKIRLSKASYGTSCFTNFCPMNAEHRKREELVRLDPLSECLMIGPKFVCMLPKGTAIQENMSLSESFIRKVTSTDVAKSFRTELYRLDGDGPIPAWHIDSDDSIKKHCTLSADLSALCSDLNKATSNGLIIGPIDYWILHFDIELRLGKVELEARVKWDVDGETKYGPVSIVYED